MIGAYRGLTEAIGKLERRGVITTDPDEATHCCGLKRDSDGFCINRPHHPAYFGILPTPSEDG